jgi:hypothetical protein
VVQLGESSLGPSGGTPPAGPAPASGVGAVTVEVSTNSICWDTTPDGLPGPHRGATVRVTASDGTTKVGTTDINGQARIEEVPAGPATVDVMRTGYTSAGPHNVTITAGGHAMLNTSIQLAPGGSLTVCTRQHTRPPPGSPTPGYIPWIFWHPAPMIWLREVAWLIFLITFATLLIIGLADIADGKMDLAEVLPLSACFLAGLAYLNQVIFGMPVGIPSIVLAVLAWLAFIGLTIAAGLGALPLPIALVSFPSLCGMWVCFLVWLAIRFSTFKVEHQWFYIFFYALVSPAIAIPIYCILAGFLAKALWQDTDVAVGYGFAVFFVAYVFGLVSSVSGHVFNNDHNLESFTAPDTPKLLPFAGYRFCVQGNRGWFSHFDNEVFCYDFAVDQATNILAIEEGHVIFWREDHSRSQYESGPGTGGPNYIWVEHRDGTVSRYFHLQLNGVRDANPVLLANKLNTDNGPIFRSDVHVHAGQVLAKAGSTGMSRFPHIHLGLYTGGVTPPLRGAAGGTNLGLTFRDSSAMTHGGKCYTFRPYQSDNADRGPISI